MNDGIEKYTMIKRGFEAKADHEKAIAMAKYMRNQFVFYGIPTPIRKAVYKELIKKEKLRKQIDWLFLDQCYQDNHREFQYAACDYLQAMRKYLTYDDIERIKGYIIQKSWWDTTDALDKTIGYIAFNDQRADDIMLKWAKDDNIWVRRVAVDHQLDRKANTNTMLLAQIIIANLNSEEFFINKAIGWALREYSKTDPQWVRNFINEHRPDMNPLSIKEASKYI